MKKVGKIGDMIREVIESRKKYCPNCNELLLPLAYECDLCGWKKVSHKPITIPKSIQQEVWVRDGGKCVECGSEEGVGYDHINPTRKGGDNTVENLQLLCKKCNKIRLFRCSDYTRTNILTPMIKEGSE